jgi:hypothetical protein
MVAFVWEGYIGGRPIDCCAEVVIPELKLGTQAESGRARIPGIASGTRMVIWRMGGALGDSSKVRFWPGKVETLNLVFRFEGRDEWGVDWREEQRRRKP